MLKQQFFLSAMIAGLFLSIIAANFARPNLFRSLGRGGGRIFIGKGWVDLTRWELEQIVAGLTPEEDEQIQLALHEGRVDVAQDLLAAATLRYFQKAGRKI